MRATVSLHGGGGKIGSSISWTILRFFTEDGAVFFIASATDIPTVPPQYVSISSAVLVWATLGGMIVYYRALVRMVDGGGRLRRDMLGIPDLPVLAVLLTVLGLIAVSTWLPKGPPAPMNSAHIIPGALEFAVFPLGILIFLNARNISIIELFGLRKVPVVTALGYGFGFLVALLPIFIAASEFAARKLGSEAKLQPLVELYQAAVRNRDWTVIWHTCLAAAVIAPISEEILFRGYLYQGLKRFIGPIPSAILGAVLFAAIHPTAAGLPGLTLLALALTIAFEWSGSLLVPIVMHALFNSLSLAWGAWTTSQLP